MASGLDRHQNVIRRPDLITLDAIIQIEHRPMTMGRLVL